MNKGRTSTRTYLRSELGLCRTFGTRCTFYDASLRGWWNGWDTLLDYWSSYLLLSFYTHRPPVVWRHNNNVRHYTRRKPLRQVQQLNIPSDLAALLEVCALTLARFPRTLDSIRVHSSQYLRTTGTHSPNRRRLTMFSVVRWRGGRPLHRPWQAGSYLLQLMLYSCFPLALVVENSPNSSDSILI